MTVGELIRLLEKQPVNCQVRIAQFFRENETATLRTIEVVKGELIIKDHFDEKIGAFVPKKAVQVVTFDGQVLIAERWWYTSKPN